MPRRSTTLLEIVALVLAVSLSQTTRAEQIQFTMNHDGLSRSYQLYLPSSYRADQPLPLLVVLHGRGGTTQRMADLTDFDSRAEHHGFAVAYPQGLENKWNYLHGIFGYQPEPNDSAFILKVIDAIGLDHNIDPNRIYVTGISNGGFMAQRLACYMPQKFAAIASVAAGGYAYMPDECIPSKPVNMLYIHGTADNKVPWGGLKMKDADGNLQSITMSVSRSLKFWSERNHCSTKVNKVDIESSGKSPRTRVQLLKSSGCDSGTEVMLYAIINGGHNWPGVENFIPANIAGQVNLDIHASDVIWTFFKSKTLAR